MAVTSAQDRVKAILERAVAEPKVRGAPSPDVEAAAVTESLALTFLLHPRTALYFACLAANGLNKAITDELAAVDALKSSISDLGNRTLAVQSTQSLAQAQHALAQIDRAGKIDVSSGAFRRFNSSIDDFLTRQLAKNVRRPGQTEMVRPGAEAVQDVPADLATLKERHADTRDRFFALAVGIKNFLSTPLSSLVSATSLERVRSSLEGIITGLAEDTSGANSRDVALQLLSARATLRVLGSAPDLSAPVLMAPGVSEDAYSFADSESGPFLAGGVLTVAGRTCSTLNQSGTHPAVLGGAVSFPVAVPGNSYLFLNCDGATLRVPLNSGSTPVSLELAQIVAAIRGTEGLEAAEFVQPGSGRLLVWAPDAATLSVASSSTELLPGSASRYVTYSNSMAPGLGFWHGQQGVSGSVPASLAAEALSTAFSDLVGVALTGSGELRLTSRAQGATLEIGGSWLGFAAKTAPATCRVQITGADMAAVVAGDRVTTPTGTAVVSEVDGDTLVLDASLPVFDGEVTVRSGLLFAWQSTTLESALSAWLQGPFSKDLTPIDQVAASLVGSTSTAHRAEALALLSRLSSLLESLGTAITPLLGVRLPSAAPEKIAANGIISTLSERHYDRALDFLLRCKIQEIFELDWETLSYGGALMKAASDLARSDIRFPDRTKDQGYATFGRQNRTGR